jgi:uncharacterized membrane protein YgcG
MRRIAAALAVVLATLAPAGAVERILDFVSDVTVERNGDLTVTETIGVQAEGNEIRRGIFRDFPTTYHRRRDGSQVIVGFEVRSVTRNGNTEDYALENMSNGVRVRIGSANRILNTGRHEYVIKYLTTRQIGFFRDFDELYWNATGNGWNFTIDRAEARITLPEAVPFRQSAFYTGPQDGNGRDASIVEERPGRIVFRTTRPLPPRNGLAVAAAWEKGVIAPPSGSQQTRWWLADNVAVPVAVLGLLGVLGFYYWAWLRVGRDPPRGTIIPLFGPPKGMSAAAVRYVNNFGFDQRCFTAAVVDLGVNGHLKITGGGSDKPVLAHRKGGKPVPPAETAMVGKLFASKSSLVLDQVNHQTLSGAESALSEGLKKAYLGKLFTNNFGLAGLGLLIVIILIGLVLISLIESHNSRSTGGLVVGVLLPLLFIIGGAGMIYEGVQRNPISLWRVIVGALLAGIAALAGLFLVKQNGYGWVDFIPAIATYVAASVTGVAFPWLQAPSVEGRQIMDQIEGFREYLGVAEEDRLNALNPPDKTPELFERFLPYAIALDVENAWAQRFAAVLAAASTAAAGTAVATSTWYAGSGNWSSDPVGFANHLGSDLSQTISSASTAPGSSDGGDGGGSGSGGGGSSGGGGGGGGGGGW